MDEAETYGETIRKMVEAAQEWVSRLGVLGLAFSLPPENEMVVAPLNARAIELLAASNTSRAFLRNLDLCTRNQATVFQVCVVVRAMELPVTDWSAAKLREVSVIIRRPN